MRSLLSFLVLQGAWLLCVGGAGRGRFLVGPVAVAVLVLTELWRAEDRPRLLRQLLLIGLGGSFLDSVQSALGLLSFRGALTPWLCPLWITALWVHFAIMLRGPLSFLAGRCLAALALGLIGGPMAYGAGVRLGAASFHPGLWPSVFSIALAWALACPLAVWLVQRKKRSEII